MQIFVTSYNPVEAASHLDDKLLNKMVLETAQILSIAYRRLFGDHLQLYKDSHLNHPCSLWARKNVYTYSWLVDYFEALEAERMKRKASLNPPSLKHHKSYTQLHLIFRAKRQHQYNAYRFDPSIFDGTYNLNGTQNTAERFFDFNCTTFKDEPDIRIAYQKYLLMRWANDVRAPKWTGIKRPIFKRMDKEKFQQLKM